MNSQYNVFLMIELAKEKGIIDKELEYDLMWEQGCGLIKEFTDSKFDRITCDLYDCISEFLRYKAEIKSPTQKRLIGELTECTKLLVWGLENATDRGYDATDIQDRINRLSELNTQIRNFK